MKNLKNKNLLIISNGYPNKSGSIVDSTFVKDQVDEISKYLNKIYVIVLRPYLPKLLSRFLKEYNNRVITKNYKYKNISVLYSKYYKLPNKISYKTVNLYKSVLKTINENNINFDLIHAHFTFPSGYVAAKIKQKFNKKLVVTGHGFDVYDFPFKNKLNRRKFLYSLNNCDYFITVSKKNMDKVNSIIDIKSKSEVIPNGFSNDFKNISKNLARKELKLSSNKKIILHVGNYLINVKNQINLIKSINELLKVRSDFILYLIGSGRDEYKIKQKVIELNLTKYIKVIGSKPHNEIPLWMNASNLFVLPSYKESFGVVNIEALACGTPVISTINGGSEEIIVSEKYGFLLNNPNNYKTLASIINKGLNKKWNRNEILKYSQKFNAKNVINKIINIYYKL